MDNLCINKSVGTDGIPSELLKAEILKPLVEEFWQNKTLQDELKEGLIVNIPKKK